MSITSKFTERFDLEFEGDIPQSTAQEMYMPASPKSSPFYSAYSTDSSVPSLNSHSIGNENSTATVKFIPIPQNNKQRMASISTPPPSPPSLPKSEKISHDALASKFKHFITSISKKSHKRLSLPTTIPTKCL